MDGIRQPRRTDYTRYVRPRRPAAISSLDSFESDVAETMTISIRFSLPRFYDWRIYGFVKNYPYISLAAAATIFIGLVLTGNVLTWLWHLANNWGGRG